MNEFEMKQSAITVIEQSRGFVVNTQQDYDNAAEVCKEIKARAKQIEEYWKPIKEQAAAAHKGICAKEKELLTPFVTAETEIKSKMVDFQRKKLEEERILREEQERWKREEAERLLRAAAEAEQAGMTEHSDYLVEVAEQTQNMQIQQPKAYKTVGTAVKTVWKARVINSDIVPIKSGSILIRPIDTAALNKIAAMVKGKSDIPGVEFYEDVSIAVSRG